MNEFTPSLVEAAPVVPVTSQRLAPYLKGAAGALVVVLLYLAGEWTYARYQEFVFMRAVISQSVDASRQRLAAQSQAAPKPTQTPQPEGTK